MAITKISYFENFIGDLNLAFRDKLKLLLFWESGFKRLGMQVSKAFFQFDVLFPFSYRIYIKKGRYENQTLVTEAWPCTSVITRR